MTDARSGGSRGDGLGCLRSTQKAVRELQAVHDQLRSTSTTPGSANTLSSNSNWASNARALAVTEPQVGAVLIGLLHQLPRQVVGPDQLHRLSRKPFVIHRLICCR
jgi:hypothetical protein